MENRPYRHALQLINGMMVDLVLVLDNENLRMDDAYHRCQQHQNRRLETVKFARCRRSTETR